MKKFFKFSCEIFLSSGTKATSFTRTCEISIDRVRDGGGSISADRLSGWSVAYFSTVANFVSNHVENPSRIEIELKSEHMEGGVAQDIPQGAGTFDGIRQAIVKASATNAPPTSQKYDGGLLHALTKSPRLDGGKHSPKGWRPAPCRRPTRTACAHAMPLNG